VDLQLESFQVYLKQAIPSLLHTPSAGISTLRVLSTLRNLDRVFVEYTQAYLSEVTIYRKCIEINMNTGKSLSRR